MGVHLKDFILFPHQRQHPLGLEVKRGLLPIMDDLRTQGSLELCNSACNILFLGVRKPSEKWRLVQDLNVVTEAVVPIHLVVRSLTCTLAFLRSKQIAVVGVRCKRCLVFIPLHSFPASFALPVLSTDLDFASPKVQRQLSSFWMSAFP